MTRSPEAKNTVAALDLDRDIVAKIARRAHCSARHLIERAYLVIGVGEVNARIARACSTNTILAIDKFCARGFARCGSVHHTRFMIGPDRLAGAACGKPARYLALPAFVLAPHLADLDAAVPLVDRPERRAGFDRLQLLRIADLYDLGACVVGVRRHALHLPRTDHPGFVDDEHIARGQQVAPLRPCVEQPRRLRSEAFDDSSRH